MNYVFHIFELLPVISFPVVGRMNKLQEHNMKFKAAVKIIYLTLSLHKSSFYVVSSHVHTWQHILQECINVECNQCFQSSILK